MRITVELPDKLSLKDIYPVTMEVAPVGLKNRLEKMWRPMLRKRYRGMIVPITCQFCQYVGEAMWHCHCSESPQRHLNVSTHSVCSHWLPNSGLLMLLHYVYFKRELKKARAAFNKGKNVIRKKSKRA